MKLDKASHKAFLYQVINLQDGQLRKYPLDKLGSAISISEKLMQGSSKEGNAIRFSDGDALFEPKEWVFLQDTIKEVKEATLPEGALIEELKEVLK